MTIQDLRAKRINSAISASGYTYEELSKLTGASKSSIQRYATGETKKIPIDFIEELARVLKVDARYLICWDDEKLTSANNGESEQSELYDYIKQFDLDRTQLENIKNYVRFTAAEDTSEK